MELLEKSFSTSGTMWTVKCRNIVEEPSDVLICSANVMLNLSGGVGADLLGRYGTKMQQELHRLIADRSPRAANQGELFTYIGDELPYKAIIHAVAVDGWYHASVEKVKEVIETALQTAMVFHPQKVTLTALATGFGDLTLSDFANALRPLLQKTFKPIEEICICLMEEYRAKELSEALFKI